MKKQYFQLIVISVLLLTIVSCMGNDGATGQDGRDGEDSESYISYTWVSGPIVFAIDDPAVSGLSYITNGYYYKSEPGSWAYAYETWDGSVWADSYTIYIDEGEKGNPGESGGIFWQDGKDGADSEDICFELSCLSIGPSFYAWSCPFSKINGKMESELAKIENAGIEIDDSSPSLRKGNAYLESLLHSTSSLQMTKEVGRKGIYRFEHYYKQIK